MALVECYECKRILSSRAKICPQCGLPIEVEVSYYENRKIKSVSFQKNGKKDGTTTLWHRNGEKAEEIHYENGKLN